MSKHARSRSGGALPRTSVRAAIALSTSAIVVASLLTMGTVTRSDASWTDNEHAVGSVGAVNCAASAGAFKTRGAGRMVSGVTLDTDADAAANVSGMLVTNDDTTALPQPAGANHANNDAGETDPDAFVNPLDATALGAVNVNLGAGGDVNFASILQLPLDNSTGVLNQYGRAASDGTSAAGSGFVTDSGVAATADAGGGYPDLGSIDLKTLVGAVNPDAAAVLSTLAAAKLTIGAVTGRATLDGCDAAFNGVASALTREYLIAGLDATINSNTVKSLNVSSKIDAVNEAVSDPVTGVSTTALGAINTGVNTLANGIVGSSSLLSLGNASSTLTVTSVDLSGVYAALTAPVRDPDGIVSIYPDTGDATIDLAALFGAPYGSTSGLNGLAPNTPLDFDSTLIVPRLTAALGSAANSFTARVQTALTNALNSMKLSASVDLGLDVQLCPLGICVLTPVGLINATVSGTLDQLTSGNVKAKVTLPPLGPLGPAVTSLLTALTSGLTTQLGGIVGNAVTNTLAPTTAAANSAIVSAATAVSTLLSTVVDTLFVSGVLTLELNAQNDPLAGNPEPVDWAGLSAGQYDVAALRIGVLDAAGTSNVHLYLGRASVGVTCSISGSGCAGY